MGIDDIPSPEALTNGFLARIRANQSDRRRSVSETIAAVQNIYLPTRHDRDLAIEFDRLFDSMERELSRLADDRRKGPSRGGRVLVVTGEPGAGKTRALSNAFGTRPELEGFGRANAGCPLLSVVAPSPFTLKALGNEIVRQLGYNSKREIPEGEVWPMARLLFREHGIRLLHIDEAQHGDQVNRAVAQVVENTLKRLLQDVEWTVWLILSGLPEVARFAQEDKSVLRRIKHVRFESLVFPDDVTAMRKAVADLMAPCAGINFGDALTDEFVHRLMTASMYQFGILVEFVQDALEICLLEGDQSLEISHFAEAYTARTGEGDVEMNVFEAERFDLIDVAASLYETRLDEYGKPIAERRLKPRTSGKRSR